jgi:hypothetical protein
MKDSDDNRGPFELYQDTLATSLSVPREHIDEALEQEQAEKDALQADEAQEPTQAASADPKPAGRVFPDETEGTD